MATHSSILAWRIPWIEESGGYRPWGCKRVEYVFSYSQTMKLILLINTCHIILRHREMKNQTN